MLRLKTYRPGFTIVELLIVIVVIGILAAITIVAYNGIQSRANDTRVKSGASQIEKAIIQWSIDTGAQPYSGYGTASAATTSGCPGATVASGWVATGTYTCALENILRARDLLPANFVSNMPANKWYSGGASTWANYMFYQCGATSLNRYALVWSLQSPSSDDTTNFNSIVSTCGYGATLYDTYGMRAGKIIQL
jgi:prepilin-type N-terminal cleavage/methylation domain-containing protein